MIDSMRDEALGIWPSGKQPALRTRQRYCVSSAVQFWITVMYELDCSATPFIR